MEPKQCIVIKKIGFSMLFIVLWGCLHSQVNKIEGIVVDNEGQPLYLALVFNADLAIGTYTNEKGQFLLETDEEDIELEVFVLGYLRKKIYPAESSGPIQVRMEKLAYDLDELVITPCDDKVKAWGIEAESNISAALHSPVKFSSQRGLSLKVPPDRQIMEIEVMALNPRIQRGSFRLRIYSIDSLGLPSEDLLHENLIVRLPRFRTRRPVSIDLKEYTSNSQVYQITG